MLRWRGRSRRDAGVRSGFIPSKTNDPGFQLLDLLLLGRQRFCLWSNTAALLLELVHPATQRGLDHPERAAGLDIR